MRSSAALLALALPLAGPASAGIVYEMETTDHSVSPPHAETVQAAVEGKSLAMEIAAGKGKKPGRMIFHGDRREMVVVDHQDKSYMVMDEEAMKAMAAQIGGAMSQMQKALENVPEDQRAMVEQMMKQRMPQAQQPAVSRSELRRTGERAKHAGYPCVKYEVLRGGEKVRELWVADWSRLEGADEVAAAFREMSLFFREMMEAFQSASGMSGMMGGDNPFEYMDQIDGFPVVTREFVGGELDSETTLRSASRRTLDPAEFEPPAGYKRRSMFPQ